MNRFVGSLRHLLSPGQSMTHRVLRAGFWSVMIRSGLRGVGFVRNVVLARLLAPDDFGLFGIALVILSILDRFSRTGLGSALVQKKIDVREYLDTAFTIQVLRGVLLGLILLLSAPYVSQLFEEPRATPFIQLLALTVFLRGMGNIGMIYYVRELEVQRQSLHHIASTVTELLVSITAAIILKSAWALMIGLLAGNVVALVVSYAVHPYRPRLRFDSEKARELSRYGRWIFLNNILFFLAYRGDNLIVGKFLGAPALGVYMLAYSISEAATVEIKRMAATVAFPAFSRIQGELQRLRKAYLLALELVTCIVLPSAIVLWLLAEPITLTLLGERWWEVALILPLLAFAGVIRAVVTNGTAVYKAVGEPKRAFMVELVGVVATYAAIFPLLQLYGLLGVGMAVLLGRVATVPVFLVQIWRILRLEWRMLGRALLPTAMLSGATALPILLAATLLARIGVAELVLVLLLAGLCYLAAALALWRRDGSGPFRLLDMARSARRSAPKVPAPPEPAAAAPAPPGPPAGAGVNLSSASRP